MSFVRPTLRKLLLTVCFLSGACDTPTPTTGPGMRPPLDLGPCMQVTNGELVMNVAPVRISGSVRIDGQPLAMHEGEVSLRRKFGQHSDLVTIADSATFSNVAVLPGKYDVVFSSSADGMGALPLNTSHVIRRDVMITDGMNLDLDITTTLATISATIAGAAPSGGGGQLALSHGTGTEQELITLGLISTVTPVRVIADTYDVVYTHDGFSDDENAASPHPRNGMHVLRANAPIMGANASFNVDIPRVIVRGNVTLDGLVPTEDQTIEVALVSADMTEALAPLDATGAYAIAVIPGTYQMLARVYADTVSGTHALGSVVATSDTTKDVSLVPTALTINVRANGVPPEPNGTLMLRSTVDSTDLGSFGPTITGRAFPGTYDLVHVTRDRDDIGLEGGRGGFFGSSRYQVLRRGVVIAGGAQTIDLAYDLARVRANVRVDGELLTSGSLMLLLPTDNLFGTNRGLELDVIRGGTYAAHIAFADSSMSNRREIIQPSLTVGGDMTIEADIRTVTVNARVMVAGVGSVTGLQPISLLRRTGHDDEEEIYPTSTAPLRIIPGRYDVRYGFSNVDFEENPTWQVDGARNDGAFLGCVEIR